MKREKMHESNVVIGTTRRVDGKNLLPSKQGIRKRIWKHLEDNNLVLFPRPVYNRIPNFKGAPEAAQRLKNLDCFKNAKTVLVNPDKPLEFARILVLEEGKKLVSPVPRLEDGMLQQVQVAAGSKKHSIRQAVSRRGLSQGKNVDSDRGLKIDLIIIGSVAVARNGLRIGKGRGYTDLEFAIINHLKVLNENVQIATIVHECQVMEVSAVPSILFGPHDVPVDIVITPTETIYVSGRPPRPSCILWSLVSQRRIDNMPALKKIKDAEERAGNSIVLKELGSDFGIRERTRSTRKFFNTRYYRKQISNSEPEPNEGDGDGGAAKGRSNRRRPRRERNSDLQDTGISDGTNIGSNSLNERKRIRRPRSEIKFSVWVGNIAKTDRVRDIKAALAERGVKPFDITWRGMRGFCHLHFAASADGDDSFDVNSVISVLSGIQIGGDNKQKAAVAGKPHVLTVQPARAAARLKQTETWV